MRKIYCTVLILLFFTTSYSQLTQTANDFVLPYDGQFRPASNIGFIPPFSEIELANIAAGNDALNVPGVGVKSFRPSMAGFFVKEYGYDFYTDIFAHYETVDLKDNTVIVGFPQESHQDPNFYCPGIRSEMFANMYTPIWDNGENGTPVNDDNYYALYLYKLVTLYKDHIRFWEIWNEPGFDYTGAHGWLNPDQPGNWWVNNPDPCDYKLRAPIFHYVRLLRISYEIIHAVDPEAYVTVSGVGFPSFLDAILRNTDNPVDGSPTPEYPLGGGAYFDVIGFHAYPHFDGSLKAWNNDIGGFEFFRHSDAAAEGIVNVQDELKTVLDNYGYGGTVYPEKHWIVTECNIPRKAIGDYIGGDEVQRNFLIKAYVHSVVNDFLQLHVFKLAEDKEYDDVTYEFEAMGLYKKMEYSNLYFQEPTGEGISYKTTSDMLFGKTYDPVRTAVLQMPPEINGAAFYDEYNNYTYVMWARTTIDGSEEASANYSFPAELGINVLQKRNWDFSRSSETTIVTSDNITLSGAPIFLIDRIFETSVAGGCAPISIDFNIDHFPGAASYIWHFEGGNPASSSSPSPTVSYQEFGDFDVSLEVRNAAGTIISAQTDIINIETGPTAGFTPSVSGPIIVFSNTAGTNTEYFNWDFGDGFTSTDANPMHVFTTSGSYLVELTVSNSCGNTSFAETITVEVPSDPVLSQTANDFIPAYDEPFRLGCNFGIYGQQWRDEQLADLAAGNVNEGIQGAGVKAIRPSLPEDFLELWGYTIRADAFQHYQNIGLEDNTLIVGFPSDAHREPVDYCPGFQSEVFAGIYEDIWDNGENGTPVNDNNYYALYLYKTALIYKDYVKFWEIWNEPGFDFTGIKGWQPPGQPGNWWDNNPDPCDYKLRAPIFHMVRLLRTSYEVLKFVDPDALITFSGIGFPSFLDAILRNTDNPEDGSVTENYPHRGGAYFDVIGFHSYPHFDGSLRYFDHDLGGFVYERHSDAAAEGIRKARDKFSDVLVDYGYDNIVYPEKHWIITECNIPRRPFSGSIGGEDPQVNFVIKAYVECMELDIHQLHMYKIGEEKNYWEATDEFELMGLYNKLSNVNPYYQTKNKEGIALKTTSDQLYQTAYDAARTAAMALPEDVGGAAFVDLDGKYTYVIWAKTTIDNFETASATYSLPAALGHTELFLKKWNYSETNELDTVEVVNIELTGRPIFLTETVVTPPVPLAMFGSDVEEGCPPFAVSFMNESMHEETLLWSFPGGEPSSSTDPNPVVVYNESGTFDVSLQVFNAVDDHLMTMQNHIFSEALPESDFDFTIEGVAVSFINNASNATSYLWDFDDGFTSPGHNPVHTYGINGDFTISLEAINECGSVISEQELTIGAAPVADFKSALTVACGGFTVFMQDDSDLSPTSWSWSFPGGDPESSTEQNVLVHYTTPGSYDVTLYVSNDYGEDEITKFEYIISEAPPQVAFTASVEAGLVTFNNMSAGHAVYHWDFGDGNTSALENPVHTYGNSGTYNVVLTASNTCDTIAVSEAVDVVIVTAPVADFELTTTSNCAPLTIDFQSLASPDAEGWFWAFPGGEPEISTEENPTVAYASAGVYSVTMQVSNIAGTDTEVRNEIITLYEQPVAGYVFDVDGTTVTFQNLSLHAEEYYWNFGDGTNSTQASPIHTYAEAGDYVVWLTVGNACSENIYSAEITIITAPDAAFSADQQIGCSPFQVEYTDMSTGIVDTRLWTFPGGMPESSAEANPVVIYTTPGSYPVSLAVANTVGNTSIAETDFVTIETTPSASFTYFIDELEASFFSEIIDAESYYWDFGDGNTSTMANPVHTYAAEGEYAISLTVTNTCGNEMMTNTIAMYGAPFAFFFTDNQTVCIPGAILFEDFSGGIVESWSWSFPGGNPATSTVQNPLVSYTVAGVYPVSLTVANSQGEHTVSFEDYIEVLSDPVVDFASDIDIHVVSFTSLAEFADSLSWAFGDGEVSSEINPVYAYPAPGAYTVTLTAFNDCNIIQESHVLEITDVFSAAFASDIIEGCAPLTVQFYDLSGDQVTSWDWSFEGGTPTGSDSAMPEVVFTEPGTYPVQLIVSTGTLMEVAYNPTFITVFEQSVAAYDFVDDGTSVQFINNAENAISYFWGFGDGNFSVAPNPVHVYDFGGNYQVSLTAYSVCDSAVFVQEVIVEDIPTAAFSADQATGCVPLTVQFENLSSANTTDWEWHFPGADSVLYNSQNPEVSYSVPGAYSVLLIVANPTAMDTISFENYITVQGEPTAGFEAEVNSAAVTFTNTSVGADSYFWDFGDGFVSTESYPFHLYGDDGMYNVILTVENACGQSVFSDSIGVNTLPNVFFTADLTEGCVPLTVQFTDMSSPDTENWAWSFPGGDPGNSIDQNPVVVYHEPGVYTVSLIASNTSGSIANVQSNLIKANEAPEAAFDFLVNGMLVNFYNYSIGGAEYFWDFGDGENSTLPNPIYVYEDDGIYPVTLTVSNACGEVQYEETVVVATLPVADFSFEMPDTCVPFTVEFMNLQSTNTTAFSWYFEGGSPSVSTDINPVVVYETAGQFDVSLMVSNAQGADTLLMEDAIAGSNLPYADFTFTQVDGQIFFMNNSEGAVSFYWGFGDGNTSLAAEPVHTYESSGIYDVLLLAENGCGIDTITQSINVIVNAINDISDFKSLAVFPNPNTGRFMLHADGLLSGAVEVNILNILGTEVFKEKYDTATDKFEQQFDLSYLPAGAYLLHFQNGEQEAYLKIVLRNRE